MRFIFILIFLSGCGYVSGSGSNTFWFHKDNMEVIWHCWIDDSNDRPERYCQKEEGFQ